MSAAAALGGVTLGVYEKALAWTGSWDELFEQAAVAGFSFLDLSIDESDARQARLEWDATTRQAVRAASRRHGVAIGSVCLSAHRAVAPGSADAAVRRRALDMFVDAIDLCADIDAPLLQLAGYFAYYEIPHPSARDRYLDVIAAGARYASRRGVLLGIENVDGSDVTSITKALEICDQIGSPYLQLYPDIGNLSEQGLDVVTELAAGAGRMVALHVKDTRRGEPRRVPMGAGIVPWDDAFSELARQGWSGRILIEMWNDDRAESATLARQAHDFIEERLKVAGIPVLTTEEGKRTRDHHRASRTLKGM